MNAHLVRAILGQVQPGGKRVHEYAVEGDDAAAIPFAQVQAGFLLQAQLFDPARDRLDVALGKP